MAVTVVSGTGRSFNPLSCAPRLVSIRKETHLQLLSSRGGRWVSSRDGEQDTSSKFSIYNPGKLTF